MKGSNYRNKLIIEHILPLPSHDMVLYLRSFVGRDPLLLLSAAVILIVLIHVIGTHYNYSLEYFSSKPDSAITSNLLTHDPASNSVNEFLSGNPPTPRDVAQKINDYLYKYHLTSPSINKPYHLNPKMKNHPSDYRFQLKHLFQHQMNGFFVEAGANDGQYISNTLNLEIEQNWTGLLIEPNPFIVPALRLVNRKAWIADVCLSTVGYPVKIRFAHHIGSSHGNRGQGTIEGSPFKAPSKEALRGRSPTNYIFAGAVDCFPLSTLLNALNQTVVDYFSFDVEGVEYKVLEHFPFKQFTIKVMSIEHILIPEGLEALKLLLTTNRYEIVYKSGTDIIVIREDYKHEYQLPIPCQNSGD